MAKKRKNVISTVSKLEELSSQANSTLNADKSDDSLSITAEITEEEDTFLEQQLLSQGREVSQDKDNTTSSIKNSVSEDITILEGIISEQKTEILELNNKISDLNLTIELLTAKNKALTDAAKNLNNSCCKNSADVHYNNTTDIIRVHSHGYSSWN